MENDVEASSQDVKPVSAQVNEFLDINEIAGIRIDLTLRPNVTAGTATECAVQKPEYPDPIDIIKLVNLNSVVVGKLLITINPHVDQLCNGFRISLQDIV